MNSVGQACGCQCIGFLDIACRTVTARRQTTDPACASIGIPAGRQVLMSGFFADSYDRGRRLAILGAGCRRSRNRTIIRQHKHCVSSNNDSSVNSGSAFDLAVISTHRSYILIKDGAIDRQPRSPSKRCYRLNRSNRSTTGTRLTLALVQQSSYKRSAKHPNHRSQPAAVQLVQCYWRFSRGSSPDNTPLADDQRSQGCGQPVPACCNCLPISIWPANRSKR